MRCKNARIVGKSVEKIEWTRHSDRKTRVMVCEMTDGSGRKEKVEMRVHTMRNLGKLRFLWR